MEQNKKLGGSWIDDFDETFLDSTTSAEELLFLQLEESVVSAADL